MTRTRWILAAVAAVLLAAATITTLLLVIHREPPPPDPFALTPDGRYQIATPLTTEGINPCDLLTAQEVGDAFDEPPSFFFRDPDEPRYCSFTGGEVGIRIYLGTSVENLFGQGIPTTVIRGHPALVQTPPARIICVLNIATDAVPGRPGLTIQGPKDDNCAIPLRMAELALSRLPAAP